MKQAAAFRQEVSGHREDGSIDSTPRQAQVLERARWPSQIKVLYFLVRFREDLFSQIDFIYLFAVPILH